jgi:hypothetical protein
MTPGRWNNGSLTLNAPDGEEAQPGDSEEVPIMIGGVSKVVIGVEDQERAKACWVETLGFEVAQDAPYGQERWLEVRTPDKAVVVVLDVRKGPRPTAPDPSLPTSSVSSTPRTCSRPTPS